MLSTALFFVTALVVSASGSCIRSATCPCGTSGMTYKFCIDGIVIQGDPCDRWTQCETCREGYPYCVTCPAGRFGGLCVTVSVRKPLRKKRQTNQRRRSRSSSARSRNCIHPGVDPNGEISESGVDERRGTFEVGNMLRYTCKTGYYLQGQATIYCLFSGSWSASRPKCKRDSSIHPEIEESTTECVELDPDDHGQMIRIPPKGGGIRDSEDDSFPIGTVLQFSCDEGYDMVGEDRLECITHGYWSDEPPSCVKGS